MLPEQARCLRPRGDGGYTAADMPAKYLTDSVRALFSEADWPLRLKDDKVADAFTSATLIHQQKRES